MRLAIALGVLCGCAQLLGLEQVPSPADAPPAPAGCADGTREGFVDLVSFPAIAACDGYWAAPGVGAAALTDCSSTNDPSGSGCSIANLCATGWHVCRSQLDVSVSSPVGCDGAQFALGTFYATQQSGPGGDSCGAAGNDDVFGCGPAGNPGIGSDCVPLTGRTPSVCAGFAPFACGNDTTMEARALVRTGVGAIGGGALCCRD